MQDQSFDMNSIVTRNSATERVAHHFTVDVEEYFQVSAFARVVEPEQWGGYESRVVSNMALLGDLLSERAVTATMFVLGWVAQQHPSMVRELAAAGHEIASHGWDHRRVTEQTPAQFRESVRRTKDFLEDLTGRACEGFRAPSFSIVPGREWALDILIEEGHTYDSSLFPIRRPGYGFPGTKRGVHFIDRPSGRLREVPPATLQIVGANLPAGGGAYLRLFPFSVVRKAVQSFDRNGEAATLYIHPWELDPEQPRLSVPWHTRIRHYGGLERTADRVRALLDEFRFQPIAATLSCVPAQ